MQSWGVQPYGVSTAMHTALPAAGAGAGGGGGGGDGVGGGGDGACPTCSLQPAYGVFTAVHSCSVQHS